MSLITVSAPPCYPVSRAEAIAWLRADAGDTAQAPVIDMLIAAMTDYAENLTARAFIQRSLELGRPDFFPPGAPSIALPQPPLLSVDYVKYIDTGGILQSLAASEYDIDLAAEPGLIQPAYLCYWPAIRTWAVNPVRIGFTCGYAPVGSPVGDLEYRAGLPAALKLWMHARIATLYENREQLMMNNQVKIPRDFADGLLDSLIVGTRLF